MSLRLRQIHSTGYIYRNFRSAIQEMASKEDASNGVVEILSKICQLYGAWSIDDNASFFLKYHFYDGKQMDVISARVASLCAELRKSAMSIVDAFAFSDVSLTSIVAGHQSDIEIHSTSSTRRWAAPMAISTTTISIWSARLILLSLSLLTLRSSSSRCWRGSPWT